jgi:hypothetical protein
MISPSDCRISNNFVEGPVLIQAALSIMLFTEILTAFTSIHIVLFSIFFCEK